MKPNFLIVGAPKCGTTALWRYLNAHPDIFMSPRKDMHFFGSDLDFTKRSRFTQKEYEQFFEHATQKAIGEASVWYLYSQKAAQEIAAYRPDMKIIIMVRDPIQIMYAHTIPSSSSTAWGMRPFLHLKRPLLHKKIAKKA